MKEKTAKKRKRKFKGWTKIAIVVILMMVVCLMVLRNLIKSMNITQALKLGED